MFQIVNVSTFFRALLLVIFVCICQSIISSAALATSTVMKVVNLGPRLVSIPDFPDGGLSSGPHTIYIYLPRDYGTSKHHYRVLYFNDGEGAFRQVINTDDWGPQADIAYDQLSAKGLIHSTILIGISNSLSYGRSRATDLIPLADHSSATGLEGYYTFISTQLKPYIDSHYRTLSAARFTGIAGYSLGGLAAFWMSYHHPETFGMAGCMSPSLWQNNARIVSELRYDHRGHFPVRFWIDGGQLDAENIEIYSSETVGILVQKGWREGTDVAFQLGYGQPHNDWAYRCRLPNMLYFLLRKSTPSPIALTLKPLYDPSSTTLDLTLAEDKAYIWPEIRYPENFYINSVTIPLHINNPEVASVSTLVSHLVLPAGKTGRTSITACYKQYRDSIDCVFR